MKKIIYAILTAIIAAAIIFCSVIAFDIFGIGGGDTPVDINIAEGAGTDMIASGLRSSGLISSKLAFKIYARLTGEHIYQKGAHTLNSSDSYGEIIAALEKMPDTKDHKVLIPEGYELRQIADTLEAEGLINREVFMREAEVGSFGYDFINEIPQRENRLEGYLYPDTYMFSEDMTEHEIIDRMLSNFNRIVIPVYSEAQSGYTLDEIIKLASVIEREAANDSERGLVSSVFINRLSIGMKLESCATVQYLLKERKPVLSNADTQIDSPYNTYKNAGLPYGPIASPGIESVKAALYPESTNYLYFLAAADGSHSLFAETFEQHLENQKQM